jgi:hypothetical protein
MELRKLSEQGVGFTSFFFRSKFLLTFFVLQFFFINQRREAVNLKKFALRTLWSAEDLEKKLLRISLICSVGDCSKDEMDFKTAQVYYYEKKEEETDADADNKVDPQSKDLLGNDELSSPTSANSTKSNHSTNSGGGGGGGGGGGLKVKKIGRQANPQEIEDYLNSGSALLTTRGFIQT